VSIKGFIRVRINENAVLRMLDTQVPKSLKYFNQISVIKIKTRSHARPVQYLSFVIIVLQFRMHKVQTST